MNTADTNRPASRFYSILRPQKIRWLLFASAILSIAYSWRCQEARWKALPNGGAMRVYKVDTGRMPHASYTPMRYELFSRFYPAIGFISDTISYFPLRSFWSELIGPKPVFHAYSIADDRHMVMWLLMRGTEEVPFSRCWLIMPDGQEFSGWFLCADQNGTHKLCSVRFTFTPKSLPYLRVRLENDDRTQSFLIEERNPFYTRSTPNWVAMPFPQTVRLNNMDLTLHDLRSSLTPMSDQNETTWHVDADIRAIMGNGEQMDWYRFRTSIWAPEGNEWLNTGVFSHPVWKVCLQVIPRPEHPNFAGLKPTVAEFYVKPPSAPEPPTSL